MSQLEVQLMGRPIVVVDGVAAAPPRGAKPWGLLAYGDVASPFHEI